MVFLLKKEENGQAYYYIAHNLRKGKKWKSLRQYVGKSAPNKKELEKIKLEFEKKHHLLLETGFEYLDKDKLEKVDHIISEFRKKVKSYPKRALE